MVNTANNYNIESYEMGKQLSSKRKIEKILGSLICPNFEEIPIEKS